MTESAIYRFGDFELDQGRFKLLRRGAVLPLEPKALDLLHALIERAPRVVEKTELFAVVWKDVAVSDNALTRLVAQLRKALDDHPRAPRFIETVATRGYRFCGDVVRLPSGAASPEADRDIPVGAAPSPGRDVPVPSPGKRTRASWMAPAAALAVLSVAAAAWVGSRSPDARRGAAAAAGYESRPSSRAALKSLRPRQISTGSGYDGFLAYSADGRSVAFASDRSGALEIYVQGVAPGSEPAALTTNGRQNVQPAWSPDGQYIAFHEMAGGGIWIVPSRGGVPRQVSTFGAHPAWSPDGRRLAFQSLPLADLSPLRSPGVPSAIWTVDAEGGTAPGQLTRTGSPAGPHLAPAWRDGNSIVFAVPSVSSSGKEGALWTVDTATAQTRLLASHELLSTSFALVPGGAGVYFAASGSSTIWWLPLGDDAEDEARPTGLPSAGSMITHLTITPDGRQLAWTVVDSSGQIWAVENGPRVRKAAAAARATPLTEGTGMHHGFPSPAGDGRLALVASRHGAPPGIYLLGPGRSLRQLTTDPASHTRPHWTPGAREVAFLSNHGNGAGVWAIEPVSGRERRLFPFTDVQLPGAAPSALATVANIAVTAAFDSLAMSVMLDGVPNIWTVPLRDLRPAGPARQVSFERHGGTYPVWSPDGRWVAYQCGDGAHTQACVVGADGTAREQLTHDSGQSWSGGWGADPDTLLLAARRNGLWNVAEISRSTRVERMLTAFSSPRLQVRAPRWDAAGRRVVFERGETAARIWSIAIR